MLKKMLKGILAIATVCAMSTSASAATTVSSWIGTILTNKDGAFAQYYYGKFDAVMKGDKVTAGTQVRAMTVFGLDGFSTTYVSYQMADSLKLSLGAINEGATWGFTSLGSWCMGCTYSANAYSSLMGYGLFGATGVHAKITLGEGMSVYAGMLDAMTNPYAMVAGKAGALSYTANYKTGTGIGGGVGLALGDSMDLGVDVAMPTGGTMGYGATVKMKNLGPGTLAAGLSMAGSASAMGVNYQIGLEPGKYMDIFFLSGTGSEYGVSLFALF